MERTTVVVSDTRDVLLTQGAQTFYGMDVYDDIKAAPRRMSLYTPSIPQADWSQQIGNKSGLPDRRLACSVIRLVRGYERSTTFGFLDVASCEVWGTCYFIPWLLAHVVYEGYRVTKIV